MSVFIPPSLRQIPEDQLNQKASNLKRLFAVLDDAQRLLKEARKQKNLEAASRARTLESNTEDAIGSELEELTDQQAEDIVDWATAQGILTA